MSPRWRHGRKVSKPRQSSVIQRLSPRFDKIKAQKRGEAPLKLTLGRIAGEKGLGMADHAERRMTSSCISSVTVSMTQNARENERKGSVASLLKHEARQGLDFARTAASYDFHDSDRDELVRRDPGRGGHGGLGSNKLRRGETKRERDPGDL